MTSAGGTRHANRDFRHRVCDPVHSFPAIVQSLKIGEQAGLVCNSLFFSVFLRISRIWRRYPSDLALKNGVAAADTLGIKFNS